MLQTEDLSLFSEALDAVRATSRTVEVADKALDIYRIDGGPELTTGGIIALAFRLGLMVGDGRIQ